MTEPEQQRQQEEGDIDVRVYFYTDGACSGNPGPGGWAYVARRETTVHYEKATHHRATTTECSGYEAGTTNNKMELMGAIKALESLAQGTVRSASVYTDSTYVKDGITKWITAWKANAWRTSKRAPVKNKDLWVRLDALRNKYDVEWHWVARNSLPEQARADALAKAAVVMRKGV